jgi:hypothetical protein
MGNDYTTTKVNWSAVQAEVNRRLGKDYAVGYLQNVWRRALKSERILEVLKELIPDDLDPGAANE